MFTMDSTNSTWLLTTDIPTSGNSSMAMLLLHNQSYQTGIYRNDTDYDAPGEYFIPPLPNTFLMKFQAILDVLRLQYVLALVIVGLIGNTFCLTVMIKTKLSDLSHVQYIIAMLVTDTIFLVNIMCLWLVDIGIDMYQLGAWCHLTTFLSHSSSFLSLWYVVCIAVDRMVFMFGLMQHTSTTLHAKMTVLALAMIAIAVFLNMSLTFGVVYIGATPICTPLTRFYRALHTLGRIDVFLNCVVPYCFLFIVVVVGGATMCYRYCGNGLEGGVVIGRGLSCPEDISQQGQVTGPIIFIGYYLLLTVPAQAFRLYMTIQELQGVAGMVDLRMVLLQKTIQYVQYTRYAFNIVPLWLFYTGFRRSTLLLFKELFRKLWRICCRPCRAMPTGSSIEDTSGSVTNASGWGEAQRTETSETFIREGQV